MNPINQQLECLLNSAARAARPLPEKAPSALEAQVLARWRGGLDGSHILLPVLRRAVLCACLLMLLSLGLSYRALLNSDNDEISIANSTVDLTLLP